MSSFYLWNKQNNNTNKNFQMFKIKKQQQIQFYYLLFKRTKQNYRRIANKISSS